jgi:hypothetical protein
VLVTGFLVEVAMVEVGLLTMLEEEVLMLEEDVLTLEEEEVVFTLEEEVIFTMEEVEALALVVGVDVAAEELELLLPPWPGRLYVEPMSPHLTLEKVTPVVGLFWIMSDGLPSVAEQGPLLPESSQFIKPPLSFQTLITRTMPRPRASPMVARPPRDWP